MTKIISLSDNAYKELKKIKSNKSFSEVILSIAKTTNKGKVLEFFGVGGIDMEKIKKLDKAWKKWSQKFV
jgi:predicted CopG family antitoxin